MFHAIEIARRTHQQEKQEALKNAVLNSTKSSAPDDDLQHIFVSMIADLTPLHLRLFGFIMHPDKFGMGIEEFDGLHGLDPEHPQAAWEIIAKYAAPPNTQSYLIDHCFRDLVNLDLLAYSNAAASEALQRTFVPFPGTLAWDFYFFISPPGDVP